MQDNCQKEQEPSSLDISQRTGQDIENQSSEFLLSKSRLWSLSTNAGPGLLGTALLGIKAMINLVN